MSQANANETTVDVSEGDLPSPEDAMDAHGDGGDAVATRAECNGCDVTAPLSELPDGDHDFATIEAIDSADTHVTVIHVCENCGTFGGTIITSEANVPKLQAALAEDDGDHSQ